MNQSTFHISVSATNLPPPFAYQYEIKGESQPNDAWKIEIDYQYLFRDELEENEILNEGFSLEENIKAEAKLAGNWNQTLETSLKMLEFAEENSAKQLDAPEIWVTLEYDGKKTEGSPVEPDEWIYLAEELIQAVYEQTGREKKLIIQIMKLIEGHKTIKNTLEVSFARREALLKTDHSKLQVTKNQNWEEVKTLLTKIYLPDYDYDRIEKGKPKRDGIYIQFGDQAWFKFYKGVNNPGRNRDVLKELEQSFFD